MLNLKIKWLLGDFIQLHLPSTSFSLARCQFAKSVWNPELSSSQSMGLILDFCSQSLCRSVCRMINDDDKCGTQGFYEILAKNTKPVANEHAGTFLNLISFNLMFTHKVLKL